MAPIIFLGGFIIVFFFFIFDKLFHDDNKFLVKHFAIKMSDKE